MSDTFPWHHIYDAHCHPTDTFAKLQDIPRMNARLLLIMATRAEDQHLVEDAAHQYGVTDVEEIYRQQPSSSQRRVIPAFGWHPWFSYQMFFSSDYDGAEELTAQQKLLHYKSVLSPAPKDDDFIRSLPEPNAFEVFLSRTEENLIKFPLALLGEVGLDKSFRIPEAWIPEDLQQRDSDLTPGGREGRKLSPLRVDIQHQRRILQSQLALAGKLRRAASVHGVQAHGILYETLAETWKGFERRGMSKRQLKRQRTDRNSRDNESDPAKEDEKISPFPPRICLHSYSGPAETVKQYIAPSVPCDIYFSFSVTINSWAGDGAGKVEAAVRTVPEDRLLIESDLHTAGEDMDKYLEEAARKICEIRGWSIEDGTAQLARNWKRFVTGREVNE